MTIGRKKSFLFIFILTDELDTCESQMKQFCLDIESGEGRTFPKRLVNTIEGKVLILWSLFIFIYTNELGTCESRMKQFC